MEISFSIFLICFLLGWISVLVHGIFIHRSGNYLKKSHPEKWSYLKPNSVLGISTRYIGGRNYFKEIGFHFSKDDLSDEKIISYKRKVKSSLFIAAIFWAFAFFVLIFFS